MSSLTAERLARGRGYLHQHGWAAAATRAAAVALELTRERTYLNEVHVWSELDIASPRPRVALPPGLRIRRGRSDDLCLLESLDTVGPHEALRWLSAGHEIWFVLDGAQAVFSCGVFHTSMPDLSMPTRLLPLPVDMAAIEGSVVAPAARGRGVAPAAWTLIADAMAERGLSRLTRRVAIGNQPARRAGPKAGFREVAQVRYRKVGPWSTRSVQPTGDSFAAWLAVPGGPSHGR